LRRPNLAELSDPTLSTVIYAGAVSASPGSGDGSEASDGQPIAGLRYVAVPAQRSARSKWDRFWRVLPTISTFLSTVVIGAIGAWFTYSYQQAQLKNQMSVDNEHQRLDAAKFKQQQIEEARLDLDRKTKAQQNELQIVKEFIPHLAGTSKDPATTEQRAVALAMIETLTQQDLAIKIAKLYPNEGSERYLASSGAAATTLEAQNAARNALDYVMQKVIYEELEKIGCSVFAGPLPGVGAYENRRILTGYAGEGYPGWGMDRLWGWRGGRDGGWGRGWKNIPTSFGARSLLINRRRWGFRPVGPMRLASSVRQETLPQDVVIAKCLNAEILAANIPMLQIKLQSVKSLCALEFDGLKLTSDQVAPFYALTDLRALSFSGTRLTTGALKGIEALGGLEALDISNTDVDNDAVSHLAKLRNLKVLLIAGTKINDAGIKRLRAIPGLTLLDVGGSIEGDTYDVLSGIPTLKVLRVCNVMFRFDEFKPSRRQFEDMVALQAKGVEINDSELSIDIGDVEPFKVLTYEITLGRDYDDEKLAAISAYLKAIPNLGLRLEESTGLTDNGLSSLRGAENLTCLSLWSGISDASLDVLRSMPYLLCLELRAGHITDEGLTKLRFTPRLMSIDLSGTEVTDRGLGGLVVLKELRSLNISKTTLSGKGFCSLSGLDKLFHVDAEYSNLDDDGLLCLAQFKKVRDVSLLATRVTPRAIAEVRGLRRDLTLTSVQP
jgi:hypothetical protein